MKLAKRSTLLGPPMPVAAAGWSELGQPGHVAGLLVLCVLSLAVLPLLLLSLILAPGTLLSLLVPRKWRKAHRRRHGREHCKSSRISERLRRIVFAADRHRCVMRNRDCQGRLNVDHVRPWSQGGMTILLNLLTLCEYHNVPVKSNYWPGVYYRGEDIEGAKQVLARERVARLNPVRWWLAILAM